MELRIRAVVLLGVASLLGGCSSDGVEPADAGDAACGATCDGAADAASDAEDAPDTLSSPSAPAGITFRDRDPRRGRVEGTISVARALDESGVSSYRVYWSDGAGARVGLAGDVPKSSATTDIVLAPGTAVPSSAIRLVAVAVGGPSLGSTGESAPVTTKGDNFPIHQDPSDGIIGTDTLYHPSVFVDAAAGKVLVVSLSRTHAEVRRCNLDGSACTALPLDPARLYQSTDAFLAATVDPVFHKILAVIHDARDSATAILLRCNLDGSSCTHANLSATLLASYAWGEELAVDAIGKKLLNVSPSGVLLRCELDGSACSATPLPRKLTYVTPLVDDVSSKVLIVGYDIASPFHPFLLRCALNGTGCTEVDLVFQGLSGSFPSAVIDKANAKLHIVTTSAGYTFHNRCELDGTACSETNLSLSMGLPVAYGYPLPVIDAANAKLIVVTRPSLGGEGPVYRCSLDGTGCTSTPVTPWPWNQPSWIDVALDAASGKLLFVGPSQLPTDYAPAPPPTLVRSNLDGSLATAHDISAGIGGDLAWAATGAIDSANKKLLVVATDEAHGKRAWLHRCSLDGTGCTHADLSAGVGDMTGELPAIAIDAANAKLLVATWYRNGAGAWLFRCNLDGTQCAYTNVSAGQGINSGENPAIAIDAANAKVLIVTQNAANQNKPSLFRCDLDGTGCTHTDLAPAGPAQSGFVPSVVVLPDALVVVTHDSLTSNPHLFRCALDGTACVQTSLPPGRSPQALVAGNKLVVVASGLDSATVVFTRCELDGTGCTTRDLAAGLGMKPLMGPPRAAVDTVANKLFVVAQSGSAGAAILRCELDGTACSYADVSDGLWGVFEPAPLFDATSARLITVYRDIGNRYRPGLLALDTW